MGQPALFLDRDGVINVDTGYVHCPEDCRFVDGIFDLVRRANAAGMAVCVVTNQAGIARGYYDEAQFQHFTTWMLARFEEEGAHIDKVYHCPHHPMAGQGEYLKACQCRKPAPGMLLAARDALGLDMGRSVMVGDTLTDMQAAASASVGTRWLVPHGDAALAEAGRSAGCCVAEHLSEIDPTRALRLKA
ncbi:D-glycero-beta-D-manno-heptose 1,7-bisphosphate 7-phosphatase [Cupriavidus necator]|uniref:D,D-heptose 1,7-bisphosphate phosphatase n=1 Tax=Cupriavidus pinatubonensis (strain JMP 134 / LMG 1197) TaxID=264198 RepID=Q474S8_CUPPJ|nr:D-glycero-beta-D-manno-heptose 1,7-bisphosphate 7-phosphatase [Cupriavidus necator]|eukprot:XP_001694838.1 histidinol phosphate phosphatase [Chlamydomonas reinhardtii]